MNNSLSQDTSEGSACKPVIPHSPRTQKNKKSGTIGSGCSMQFTTSFTKSTFKKIQEKAQREERSMGSVVREATRIFFEKEEQ